MIDTVISFYALSFLGRWDGSRLVIPHAPYENWDAHKIYGCLCDYGYTGKQLQLHCPVDDCTVTTMDYVCVFILYCLGVLYGQAMIVPYVNALKAMTHSPPANRMRC